jgi:hypothetical protein
VTVKSSSPSKLHAYFKFILIKMVPIPGQVSNKNSYQKPLPVSGASFSLVCNGLTTYDCLKPSALNNYAANTARMFNIKKKDG